MPRRKRKTAWDILAETVDDPTLNPEHWMATADWKPPPPPRPRRRLWIERQTSPGTKRRLKVRELGRITHDPRRVTAAVLRGQHIVGNRLLNPKPDRTIQVEVKIGRTAPDFSSTRGFFAGPKESEFSAVACIRGSAKAKTEARCGSGRDKSPTEATALALRDLGAKTSRR